MVNSGIFTKELSPNYPMSGPTEGIYCHPGGSDKRINKATTSLALKDSVKTAGYKINSNHCSTEFSLSKIMYFPVSNYKHTVKKVRSSYFSA